MATLVDSSELERALRKLRESEAKLKETQRIAHVGWWELDCQTSRVVLSDEAGQIFGLEPVDLTERHGRWLELIHPQDRTRAAEAAAAALRGGPRYDIEYRLIRPDGAMRTVHSQGDVIWDDSGRPLRQFGVMQDVTDLRRAEDELRASEERFRTFVENATDAFFLHDHQLRILDVNRQACLSLGYSREDLIGMHPQDFDVGLDEAGIERLRLRISAGETATFETLHRRKDRTVFPVEIRVAQVEQGGRRYLALARDITERKRAEAALRASEERFRALVQFSFDVFWESDAQHRFTRQEFAEGLADAPARGSEIGKTRWEVPYLEPDEEAWRRHRETLDAHLPFRDFELVRPTPEGGKRYVSVSGLPVFDETGRFVGYRGVGRHITEKKRAEQALREMQAQLAHASRIATMGQLTASIAHEVNQPITATLANAQAALRWLRADEPNLDEVRQALERIVRDAGRAGSVIARIRTFFLKTPPRGDRLEINAAVREVIEFARSEATKNDVSMRAELAADLPLVQCDRVQLQQIILNLVLNAIEAMSGMSEGPRELWITTGKTDGGDILAAVRDSGPGLAPTIQENLFKAFHTTKPNGLGLGLSICRSIIEAHGGRLWASANTPRGAVFQFTLPGHQDDPSLSGAGHPRL
jgi:PAS domain S-box-containing protein